ncbi:phosphopyruvate hydratase [Asanoa siamensis]|uniref:Enolase n=1 Tax=Asanoa siamensis TaxID=926357 RepID=A0ABQ4CQK4_9ACTN|nr:phosphopyruvate hydratase [Asanoa siamensis]GIF73554.1 enolase [Asanoa siamensis]
MTRVREVRGWEALDSRGRPTVACRVLLDGGAVGLATVPSGASAGSHEAVELRDGGARYGGRGVRTAVSHVEGVLAAAVAGVDVAAVDDALPSVASPPYASVGANAVLAVSVAAARAAAADAGVSLARHLTGAGPLLLPMPMVNVVSGGAHAGSAIDIQDVLVVPHAAGSFAEAIEWASAVRAATARLALDGGHDAAALVADEGGLGLRLPTNRAALELVVDGIEAAGLTGRVGLALDLAATEFFADGAYQLRREGRHLTAAELVDEVASWCVDYPVLSVEDPLAEDDWAGWAAVTARLPGVQLVGDDLFVTDLSRLSRGVSAGVANAVLVKPNQNGLVSGAAAVVAAARSAGYRTIVSARSGETEDAWVADLAVGWRAGQIKVGSTHRSERTAKWNRLLEFEALEDTTFAGPWEDVT